MVVIQAKSAGATRRPTLAAGSNSPSPPPALAAGPNSPSSAAWHDAPLPAVCASYALASAAVPVPVPVPKVALLRLGGLGLSEGVRRNLEALVISHLRQMPYKQLVAPEALAAALARPENAALQRCTQGPACQTRRGAVAGADIVVYGTVSALGNDYSLGLRALCVANGQEISRQNTTLSGNLDVLIAQMRVVTYKLLAPEALYGSLMIDTAVAGISVQVDGKPYPPTPWASAADHLALGAHHVHLEGFSMAHGDVTVQVYPFETTQVQVALGRPASGSRPATLNPVAR